MLFVPSFDWLVNDSLVLQSSNLEGKSICLADILVHS